MPITPDTALTPVTPVHGASPGLTASEPSTSRATRGAASADTVGFQWEMFPDHCLEIVIAYLDLRATGAVAGACKALHRRLEVTVLGRRMEAEIDAQEILRRAAEATSPEAFAAVMADTAANPMADRETVAASLVGQLNRVLVGRGSAEQMLRIALDKEPFGRACRLRYGCCRMLFTNEQIQGMRERDLARWPELPPQMRGDVLAAIVSSHGPDARAYPDLAHRYLDMTMALAPASRPVVVRALVTGQSPFSYFNAGPSALPLYSALISGTADMHGPDGNLDGPALAILESLVAPLRYPIATMGCFDFLRAGSFRPVFDAVCDLAQRVPPPLRGRVLQCLAAGLRLRACAADAQARTQGWLQLSHVADAMPPEPKVDVLKELLGCIAGATPAESGVYRQWWFGDIATLPAPQLAQALKDFLNGQTHYAWNAATMGDYGRLLESLPPQHRSQVLATYIDMRREHATLPEIDARIQGLPAEHRELPLEAVLRWLMVNYNWRQPFEPREAAAGSAPKRQKGDDALTWVCELLGTVPVASRARVLSHHLGSTRFTAVDRAWREFRNMVQNLPSPERESGIYALVHATLRPGQRKTLQLATWTACLEAVRALPPASPHRATALQELAASIDVLPAAVRAVPRQQIADAAPPPPDAARKG